ncbi:UNVERIFIED_CONTAM: hypothetical protein PYX00_011675 [Menopon gallinae]|uniref:Uncharacterized protein n=1 Tax=Menopon gallinae TaxID=328185 RepID=A0AAW2H869_9NEOP
MHPLPHKVEVTTHNLHFHDQASIYSVDSRDSTIATAGGDTDVRIWAVETLAPKSQQFCYTHALTSSVKIHYRHTLSAHQRTVNCVRFGGDYLASCSDGGHVLVWNTHEFEKDVAHTVRAPDGDDAYEIAWGGGVLFVGLASGNISVYEVAAQECGDGGDASSGTDAAACKENDTCGNGSGGDTKRARITRIDALPQVRVRHMQTVRAHQDIVQGLSFNPHHSILATQSRDRTAKVFHFGCKLAVLHKYESFGDGRSVCAGKAFFKRLSFAKKNFLFLTHCCTGKRNAVFVYAYPFRSLYACIGPFDSAVQRVHDWGEYIAVITKRSLYVLDEADGAFRSVFAVNNATFLPITDACVAGGLLVSPVFNVVRTSFIQNHIIASIINNNNVFCVGPPRSGKSSACLLAALQLIKDRGLEAVFLAEDPEDVRCSLSSLKGPMEITFDGEAGLRVAKARGPLLDLTNRMVVVDNAEGLDVDQLLESIGQRAACKVVLVADEKIPVPKAFAEGRAKLIEIKALREGRSAEKGREGGGRRGDRRGGECRRRNGRGAGTEAHERAGAEERRECAGGTPRARDRKEARRGTKHVIIPQKNIKEEFPSVLRDANLKNTWRSNEDVGAAAIYGGLRHTINSIEGVLKSLGIKYSILDKKQRDRDMHNVMVVPEGAKKPTNRRFDIVINYVFPETFEEYELRAENTRKVVSFIENIDEGFKRKLGKLLADSGQKVPALLAVRESSIDEFDAFQIEPEQEEASDTDLWL